VDTSPYELDFSALRLGKRIGEGSFGKVYLATWNETPVAVKMLVDESTALDQLGRPGPAPVRDASSPLLAKLREEAGLMASLRHPNIVQFMGLCTLPPCVVTEYCAKGSLGDVLRLGRQGKGGMAEELGWHRRLVMATDAATGMLHLHARNPQILHRDLKSANLLVDAHWKVKVSDFNLSRLLEESTGSSTLASMNPRWLAPELLTGDSASSMSDVFAFGVVLWELLTWQLPWAKDNPWSIVHIVGNGGRLQIPTRWDLPGPDTVHFAGLDDYVSLLQRCWAQNPFDRPSFNEIIIELRALQETVPAITSSASGLTATPSKAPPSATAAAPSPAPGVVMIDEEDGLDYELDEGVREMLSMTASMSSTAAAASMGEFRSMPQVNSQGGWANSLPPVQEGRRQR